MLDQWTAFHITHNATSPMGDITGDSLSDYMQLLMEPRKALCYIITYAVVLTKTSKHPLMLRNWWIYPLSSVLPPFEALQLCWFEWFGLHL